jgi:hypothetical protein
MDELIESLKQQDELSRQKLDAQNRIRLHDATIIRAKATDFWDIVYEHIQRLCGEMREAFPSNADRQLFVQAIPSGFFLNASCLPRRILSAQLDIDGQRVKLSERIKHSFDDNPQPERRPAIGIKVWSDDELRFTFIGKPYDDPTALARALVSYVLNPPI